MIWIVVLIIVIVLIFWKKKSRSSIVSYMVPRETLEFPQFFNELEGHDLLIKRIIYSALFYRSKLSNDVNKTTAATLEFIYFLLHIVDRQLFSLYGADKRDEIYDKFSNDLIIEFSDALLKNDTPVEVKIPLATSMGTKMLNDLDNRQEVYSKCESIFGEKFPSAGTMIFALAFYIYRALGKTNIDNVDDVLIGKKKVEMEDLAHFPSIENIIALHMYMADIIIDKLEIDKCLKTNKNDNNSDEDTESFDKYDEMTDEELDAELAGLNDDDFETDKRELK